MIGGDRTSNCSRECVTRSSSGLRLKVAAIGAPLAATWLMAAVKVRYGGFRSCYDHWGTWVSCRLW